MENISKFALAFLRMLPVLELCVDYPLLICRLLILFSKSHMNKSNFASGGGSAGPGSADSAHEESDAYSSIVVPLKERFLFLLLKEKINRSDNSVFINVLEDCISQKMYRLCAKQLYHATVIQISVYMTYIYPALEELGNEWKRLSQEIKTFLFESADEEDDITVFLEQTEAAALEHINELKQRRDPRKKRKLYKVDTGREAKKQKTTLVKEKNAEEFAADMDVEIKREVEIVMKQIVSSIDSKNEL